MWTAKIFHRFSDLRSNCRACGNQQSSTPHQNFVVQISRTCWARVLKRTSFWPEYVEGVCRLSILSWECTSQALGLYASRWFFENWSQTGWRNPRKMSYKWVCALNERIKSSEKWTDMQGWAKAYKSCRLYPLAVPIIRVILHNCGRRKFYNPTKFKNFLGTDLKNRSKM